MAPVERTTAVKSTPVTIWSACFEQMKWDVWDPDVKEMKDVSGGCVNGTTFVFVMHDGSMIPMELRNVVNNTSLSAFGSIKGGAIKLELDIVISPIDASNSNINYIFQLKGCLGT
eukprot:CAMPEP_0197833382 /NCGR_PEP_ID=MMETSP1437-20131217/18862_1 /TAXON_ID=49252 ORGANISM="Eucampia antarctica, Strain CCMP1452" /NCGR_SAMPLE_ID=MMETSP1437 /ASSEMBLY_ACC=CAM_ASM_001096 /LENGTH=114 /DNA_ID=CAMNT_0043437405 /DNA_START=82 /DNA_END=423 /DNA_ORIENTATION=+